MPLVKNHNDILQNENEIHFGFASHYQQKPTNHRQAKINACLVHVDTSIY